MNKLKYFRDRTSMIALRKVIDTIEFQRRFRLAELNHDIRITRNKYIKHIERAKLLRRVGYTCYNKVLVVRLSFFSSLHLL